MKETANNSVQLASVQTERQQAASRVVGNIQQASRKTGISFSYLMAQAGKESDFQTNTSSRASSAAGLYQFPRGTWLQLIKQHGANHGLGDLASKIHATAHGEYTVSDPAARQEILDLRRDPKMSAMMAGEYAKDNKVWLERTLGRPVSSTDLYMAHFLGPGGAAKVLKARDVQPEQSAADLVPQAARKNPTVFYDSNHTAQSVTAVYDKIHHAIERPMQQYAKMEEQPTPGASMDEVAAVQTKASRHQHAAAAAQLAKAGDASWPFEQSTHWPPAYVPPVNPLAMAATAILDRPEQVSYTDESKSADQISAPMPPAPGLSVEAAQKAGFGKLLKGLFG